MYHLVETTGRVAPQGFRIPPVVREIGEAYITSFHTLVESSTYVLIEGVQCPRDNVLVRCIHALNPDRSVKSCAMRTRALRRNIRRFRPGWAAALPSAVPCTKRHGNVRRGCRTPSLKPCELRSRERGEPEA